jgi:hypothetical protein
MLLTAKKIGNSKKEREDKGKLFHGVEVRDMD